MTSAFPTVPAIGAIVYPPDRPPEALVRRFVTELRLRGFQVGGLIQETTWGSDDHKTDMDVIELDSGRRLSITQDLGSGSTSCSLDLTALAEASGAIRRAVATESDLVMASKFGKIEKEGRGLAAEILSTMVAGAPLLTTVPSAMIEDWLAFTGGRGQLLMPDIGALWRWWGAHHLYDDLMLSVADALVQRVVIGLTWTLVEGPDGIGLAQTPDRGKGHGMATVPEAGSLRHRSLRDLAGWLGSWNPFEAAIGLAAVNAHTNRYDLDLPEENGLDLLTGADPSQTVIVGAFPGIARRMPGARIIERNPTAGEFPAEAAPWLLPSAETVIITASALGNRTLPGLLSYCDSATVSLVGPSAPLTPRLFSYGISACSGLIATDPDGLARTVAEGGGAHDLKRHARMATVARPLTD